MQHLASSKITEKLDFLATCHLSLVKSMEPSEKRRKVDKECLKFNKEWTKKFFFIEWKGKAPCLICRETVAVLKDFNINRHYETKYNAYGLWFMVYGLLLFHMTHTTSRSVIKAIACSKPIVSEHQSK